MQLLINLHYNFMRLQGSGRGVDSSNEEYGEGRGMTDHSTFAELGESNEETTGYDNLTDSFAGDIHEKTDDSLLTEWINKTTEVLPNNNAVTAENMQPILRTVSTFNEWLLRHGL